MPDKWHVEIQIAPFDEFLDFGGDWQMHLGLLFCGELQRGCIPVVVARAKSGGCAAPDSEVTAEQQPKTHVGWHDVEHVFKMGALDGDAAGSHCRVVSDLVVEFARAVLFPEPAKDTAQGGGCLRFMTRRPWLFPDCFVGFLDVGGAEFAGLDVAARGDELPCRAAYRALVAPREFGEKQMGDSRPFAGGFGWASSFCSSSNVRAARRDVKDFRLRLPLRSRQSA